MKFENYIPTDKLKLYIKSYTVIETSPGTEAHVLPHCGLVIAFPFKGHVSLQKNDSAHKISSVTLSGMRKTFRRFRYEKNSGNILITFTETGASAFFREPVNELFESIASLDTFFEASETCAFEDQVATAKSNSHRIDIAERFLMNKLITPKRDNMVVNAIHEIYFHQGMVNVHSLTCKFAISQDAFEKRFRKAVGATPKQFASIVRMKSVVSSGKQSESFTELGYDFGFYDQSHFIKEFKSFTGKSPSSFFKSPHYW